MSAGQAGRVDRWLAWSGEDRVVRGSWPARLVCRFRGHVWADWRDGLDRTPCERCWFRRLPALADAGEGAGG